MSKRMVTYKVGDDKIVSIDGHDVGSGGVGDKSISRRMITYKVDDAGKITSIDGHELGGGGGGYEIKPLTVTENGVYDVAGEAYKPVRVNVPQTAQSGTVKALLDATKSANRLFYKYNGTSVAELISFNDTANVTTMWQMFTNSNNLTTIPELNTSNVTDMYAMFSGCHNLTTISQLDTAKVTNMENMFYECSNLTAIPALNASAAEKTFDIFYKCTKLTSIGLYGFKYSISITTTALQHDAIVALLNQAGTAYNSSQTIKMGSAKLALLTDEEKAIATNKGWQLA